MNKAFRFVRIPAGPEGAEAPVPTLFANRFERADRPEAFRPSERALTRRRRPMTERLAASSLRPLFRSRSA